MKIDRKLTAAAFKQPLNLLFDIACAKAKFLDGDWDLSKGAPVFTVEGKYTARSWTKWTQGFAAQHVVVIAVRVAGEDAEQTLTQYRFQRLRGTGLGIFQTSGHAPRVI